MRGCSFHLMGRGALCLPCFLAARSAAWTMGGLKAAHREDPRKIDKRRDPSQALLQPGKGKYY